MTIVCDEKVQRLMLECGGRHLNIPMGSQPGAFGSKESTDPSSSKAYQTNPDLRVLLGLVAVWLSSHYLDLVQLRVRARAMGVSRRV